MSTVALARPGKKRRRFRRCPSYYKYVRKVKGNKWQARMWLGSHGGSWNLGLYESEWAADQVVSRWNYWVGKIAHPVDILARLRGERVVPAHVLARRVYLQGDGTFAVGVRKNGVLDLFPVRYATEREAYTCGQGFFEVIETEMRKRPVPA